MKRTRIHGASELLRAEFAFVELLVAITVIAILIGEIPSDKKNLGWFSGTRATLRNTGSFEEVPYRRNPEAQEGAPEPYSYYRNALRVRNKT